MTRARWIASGAVGVLLLAVVLVWFQPQTLLFDTAVDEELAGLEDLAGDAPSEPIEPSEPDGNERAGTSPPEAATPESTESTESTEPSSPETAEDSDDEATAAAGPVVEARGSWVDQDHPTSGDVLVVTLEDGSRVLRFEDLRTDNGPDLDVWVSTAPAGSDNAAFTEDFVELAPLKGNVGNQNYELPADLDVGRYPTVVIWCTRFSVAFGAADLA